MVDCPGNKAGMIYIMCECVSPGTAFNQLAALAGDKNEYLDAVYYYLRRYVVLTIAHLIHISFAKQHIYL